MSARLRWIAVVLLMLAVVGTCFAVDTTISLLKALTTPEIKDRLDKLVQNGSVRTSLDQGTLGNLMVSENISDQDELFVQSVNEMRKRFLTLQEEIRPGISANIAYRWGDSEKIIHPLSMGGSFRLPGIKKLGPTSGADSEQPKMISSNSSNANLSASPTDSNASGDDAITLASSGQVETILIRKGKEIGIIYEARFKQDDSMSWKEHIVANDQALASKHIDSSRCIRLWNGLDSSSAQPPQGFDGVSPLRMLTAGFAQSTKDMEASTEKAKHALLQIGDSNSWLTVWNSKIRRSESIEIGIGITQVTAELNSKIKEGLSWKTVLLGAQKRAQSGHPSLGVLYLNIENQIAPRLSDLAGLATDSKVEVVICGGSFLNSLLNHSSAKKPASGTINMLISDLADNPTSAALGLYSNAELASGAMLLKVIAEKCGWTKGRPDKDFGVEFRKSRFCAPLGVALPKLYNMVSP